MFQPKIASPTGFLIAVSYTTFDINEGEEITAYEVIEQIPEGEDLEHVHYRLAVIAPGIEFRRTEVTQRDVVLDRKVLFTGTIPNSPLTVKTYRGGTLMILDTANADVTRHEVRVWLNGKTRDQLIEELMTKLV